jgi:hypothetical protein
MRARRRSVSALLLLAQLCGSQNQTSSVRSPNTPAGVQCLNLTAGTGSWDRDRKAKFWALASLNSTNASVPSVLYAVPYNADEVLTVTAPGNVSTLTVLAAVRSFQTAVIDAVTLAARYDAIVPAELQWRGGCVDERFNTHTFYAAPFNSHWILEYSPAADPVARGIYTQGLYRGQGKYYGMVCTPAGKVVTIPWNANQILILDNNDRGARNMTALPPTRVSDPVTPVPTPATFLTRQNYLWKINDTACVDGSPSSSPALAAACTASFSGPSKWTSGVAIGEAIYAAPFDAEYLLKIDVSSDPGQLSVFSTTAVQTGRSKWDGTVAIGAVVYAPPYNAEMVLAFDTTTGTASSAASIGILGCSGWGKWSGAVAFNGVVYAAPYRCDILLAFRPSTGEIGSVETSAAFPGPAFITYSNPYRAEWDRPSYLTPGIASQIPGGELPAKWTGLAVLGTKLYAGPLDANCVLEVDVAVVSWNFVNSGANSSRRLQAEL